MYPGFEHPQCSSCGDEWMCIPFQKVYFFWPAIPSGLQKFILNCSESVTLCPETNSADCGRHVSLSTYGVYMSIFFWKAPRELVRYYSLGVKRKKNSRRKKEMSSGCLELLKYLNFYPWVSITQHIINKFLQHAKHSCATVSKREENTLVLWIPQKIWGIDGIILQKSETKEGQDS